MPRSVLRTFFASAVCLLCLGLFPSSGLAASEAPEDPTPAVESLLEHLRSIDRQLGRWERQIVHPRGAGPSAAELKRVEGHLRRLASDVRATGDESAERKRHILLRTVAGLRDLVDHQDVGHEDLEKGGTSRLGKKLSKLRPVLLDAPPVLPALEAGDVATKRAVASKCASALEVEPGSWLLGNLHGATWLRFDPAEKGTYRLDTRGSRTDTALRVYGSCDASAKVLASADDGLRLQASTRFEASAEGSVYLRVESAEAGAVRLGLEKVEGEGAISGTVTRASDGSPISSLQVVLAPVSGYTVSEYTADDGTFEFTQVDDGFYYVFTIGYEWLNQAWEGVECGTGYSTCENAEKTPIRIQSGEAVTGIDFSLGHGASIRGQVLDASTGLAIGDVEITIHDELGYGVRSGTSDGLGRYEVDGLVAGSYRAVATIDEYEQELYLERPCPEPCDEADGDVIELARDGAVGGIDFTLAPKASIEGRVTDGVDGLANATVSIRRTPSSYGFKSVETDADGYYRIGGLDPGEYQVFARALGHLDELWNDVPCEDSYCDSTTGDVIVLSENEARGGIDFELARLGSLVGTVRGADTGEAVTGGEADLYGGSGAWLDDDWVSSGTYSFFELAAGTYFARATAPDYRPEAWSDLECWGSEYLPECDVTSADAISVSQGSEVTADFELTPLGYIEGRVEEASDGSPITEVSFSLYRSDGSYLGSTYNASEIDGTYRLGGFRPGDYYLVARSGEFRDELWNDVTSEPEACDPTTGTAITVALGATTTGIDFALVRQGSIEGAVTDAVTGDPVGSGRAYLFDASGDLAWTSYWSSGGFVFGGLEPGDYYLQVEGGNVHVRQVWEGQNCFDPSSCDPTGGTEITVADETVVVADVVLDRGAILEGSITTDDGGYPDWGRIRIYDELGQLVESESATTSWKVVGLAPGTYYALMSSDEYRDELFSGFDCQDEATCDPTAGTPIVVDLADVVTGIDFSLTRLPSLAATVKDARSGKNLPSNGRVTLYDEAGNYLNTDYYSQPSSFDGLEAGTYYLKASNYDDHVSRILGGEICDPDCDPTTGTPIVVSFTDGVVAVDFPLEPGPGVLARIVDASTGLPVEGAAVDVWDEAGNPLAIAVSDATGWLRHDLAPGTYYLSTDNVAGLPNELWDDVPCPGGSAYDGACDPLDGTPFVVEEYQPAREIEIRLGISPMLLEDGFENGFEAWSTVVGGPPP